MESKGYFEEGQGQVACTVFAEEGLCLPLGSLSGQPIYLLVCLWGSIPKHRCKEICSFDSTHGKCGGRGGKKKQTNRIQVSTSIHAQREMLKSCWKREKGTRKESVRESERCRRFLLLNRLRFFAVLIRLQRPVPALYQANSRRPV